MAQTIRYTAPPDNRVPAITPGPGEIVVGGPDGPEKRTGTDGHVLTMVNGAPDFAPGTAGTAPGAGEVVAGTGAGSTLALGAGQVPVGDGTNVTAKAAVTFDQAVVNAKSLLPRWTGTEWTADFGQAVDIRDYAVDPTGNADSAPAIMQALAEAATVSGGPWPVLLGNGRSRATYTILSTIVLPEGGQLIGGGQRGYNAQLTFAGADLTAPAVSGPLTGNRSGALLASLRIIDGRTDPARTGVGILLDQVRDYIVVRDCMVQSFYDNYFVGSTVAGKVGDRGELLRCWSVNPLRYGAHLWRLDNQFTVQDFWSDTATQGVATINLAGVGSQGARVNLIGISHENSIGAHTVQSDGTPFSAMGVTCLHGTAGTGDVIRLTSGYGEDITLTGITAATGAAANLLNLVQPGYTIPVSERRISQWVGYGVSNTPYPAAVRIGKAKLQQVGATPEALIAADPGSVALRDNGMAYLKRSGVTNSGWNRLATYSDAAATITASGAAGTTPTISVSGDGRGGKITLTTGTTPPASQTVFSLTFGAALSGTPKAVTLSPLNGNAAALSGAGQVYADTTTVAATGFNARVGSTALAASTQYVWAYTVME